MSKYILAIDAGTTSNRAVLVDHSGKIVGTSQREFEQIFPEPGWVEHDPEEIWATQKFVIRDLMKKKNVTASEIAAIGITNQRETTLVWNRKTGKPIYNAIVWQDRRTASFCDRLKKEGKESIIKEKTGLLADAYFSGTKIRWILENVAGAMEEAQKGNLAFGTVDTWLVWRLTHGKRHITEVSNASRTLLFNIHTLEWDSELLEMFGIPVSMLPEVKSSSELMGTTVSEHFGGEIAISGIAGDQQAALFGQMCVEEGMAKNTYGTGCFMVMNTGKKAISSKHNLLTTIAWKINDEVNYALEGSIFVGGAVVQWLRDKLHIINSSEEIESLAAGVKDNGGVYFVPAFVGLGAPHWDQYATGTIIGLSRGSTDAHIARAALESIALQSMDVIHAMAEDSGISLAELRVDGGAVANNLLLQIQSNMIQKKVVRPEIIETTALGAAYLAGLAVGFWDSIEQLKQQWAVEKTFEPEKDAGQYKSIIENWNKALSRSKNWYTN
ncbi:MAG: glycerol kinase GlpK [Bacteroidales bacterium]|nr:glycerol kinase GlpK [Bacteroidales bacterium]MCF8389740.1 glycerol kinase GlpK [Bacteroidales bacterium]